MPDTTHTYNQQWSRVQRWFERFKELADGREDIENNARLEDDIHAFFLNCCHLKDWIKNDPTAGDMFRAVEDFINDSTTLPICAEVCNGLKHLSLNRKPKRSQCTNGTKIDKIFIGTGPTRISNGFLRVADSGNYDTFGLAQQCMMDSQSFI